MENFKVTNIDGETLKQETQNEESKDIVQEQTEDQGQAQVQEEPVLETQQEEVKQEEATEVSQETPEAPTFETASLDFDEPTKTETAEVEHDVPNKVDLRNFIEENNDLINEYTKVNRDFDKLEVEELIEAHLKDEHPTLSQEDINTLLEDYKYDAESDDKATVVKKKLEIERAAKNAKKYLTEKRDNFLQDLGSRQLGGPSPEEVQAAELAEAAKNSFMEKTNEVFSGEVKSFDFQMSDTKKLSIKINNAAAVKSQQSDINNFIGRYFDLNTGQPTDAEGYHKAMFVAMNHEQLLQNAYQQGKADQQTAESASAKNIDMKARSSHTETQNKKTTWRLVE